MATETEAPAQEQAAEPQPWKWTREEYHRLGECGFFDGRRVELIEGEIVVMSPMNDPHAIAIVLGRDALAAAFGAGFTVRPQLPLRLPRSEPNPDLAVVTGTPRDGRCLPADTVLVVEVSDTTVRTDLGRKAELYARNGIPEYWVVDLNRFRLVVHRAPGPGGYADVAEHAAGAAVEPLARPGRPVAVSDFLP